jgi:molecular chaperone GrpE
MTSKHPTPPADDSAAAATTGDDAVAPPVQELEAARAELARLRDIAGRSQADLQNAKERLQREAADIRLFAAAGIVERLLPTVDNFRRAFKHLPAELADAEWVKGVQAVEQDLLRRLEEAGLKRMECEGQPVDPVRHEVLQAGPGAVDVILEVFEDGYEFNGRVLRPAKVKVGDGSQA